MPETETNPHVVRVGWSVDKANLQVSEALWFLDPSGLRTHKDMKLNFPMQPPLTGLCFKSARVPYFCLCATGKTYFFHVSSSAEHPGCHSWETLGSL